MDERDIHSHTPIGFYDPNDLCVVWLLLKLINDNLNF